MDLVKLEELYKEEVSWWWDFILVQYTYISEIKIHVHAKQSQQTKTKHRHPSGGTCVLDQHEIV